MTILVEPMEITTYDKEEEKNYDPHLATLMRAIFGPRLGKVKICHMMSANEWNSSFFNSSNQPLSLV
ncbi:MAG: hypothetical protein ACJ70O_00115 [Nitrososphaera sp.]